MRKRIECRGIQNTRQSNGQWEGKVVIDTKNHGGFPDAGTTGGAVLMVPFNVLHYTKSLITTMLLSDSNLRTVFLSFFIIIIIIIIIILMF